MGLEGIELVLWVTDAVDLLASTASSFLGPCLRETVNQGILMANRATLGLYIVLETIEALDVLRVWTLGCSPLLISICSTFFQRNLVKCQFALTSATKISQYMKASFMAMASNICQVQEGRISSNDDSCDFEKFH